MTKITPVAEILCRIRPLAHQHQIAHLRGLISSETHGSRRLRLESLLEQVMSEKGRAA